MNSINVKTTRRYWTIFQILDHEPEHVEVFPPRRFPPVAMHSVSFGEKTDHLKKI